MTILKNRKLAKTYILFFVIFYLVWTIAELEIHPSLNQIVPDGSVLSQLLFDGILKNLCWTVPALMLMTKFDTDLFICKTDLLHNPVDKKEVLLVFMGEIAFCVINAVTHGIDFRLEKLTECIAFLFVGITEEFVFRGWLLNASLTKQNTNLAIAVNAVLFLSIHFPIWLLYGNFITYFVNFGFLTIILLSVFFSWSMLHFRNIWVPAGLHMLWDILVTLLN